MGSIDKACISGFLCRLCSEMHRIVIHIYGDQGRKHSLVEKINGYLPITISPTDPLPKTICETCLRRVEQHYDLLLRLEQYREKKFNMYKKLPQISSLCRAPARASIGTNTETISEEQNSQPTTNCIDLTATEETDSLDTEDDDSSDTEEDDLDVIGILTNTNGTTDMDCDIINNNLPSTSSQQQSQQVNGSE